MLHHLRQTPLFCMQSILENHWSALHRTWLFSPQEGTFSVPVWTHGDRNFAVVDAGLAKSCLQLCSGLECCDRIMHMKHLCLCEKD